MTLRTATRDGHTVLPADLVVAALQAEGISDPAAAIVAAVDSGDVLEHEPPLPRGPGLPSPTRRSGRCRWPATAWPRRRWPRASPGWPPPPSRIADPASVRSVAKGLDKAQQAAVAQVLDHGVSLLTGGPGTGKSRTVAAIVQAAAGQGHRHRAGRPDRPGREAAGGAHRPPRGDGAPAARRAGHDSGGFARNEEWPLDADVIVVDEASMLDVELTAALLEACPDGTHLLLVGDPAQLPSIGPGHVLGDLIDSGAVAGDRADHAVPAGRGRRDRPAGDGGARRRAPGGRLPRPRGRRRAGDRISAEARAGWCSSSPTRSPGRWASSPGSVQVVTPVHRGPAGTIELNKALKAELNPGVGHRLGLRRRRPRRGDGQPPRPRADRLRQRRGRRGDRTGEGSLDVAFASGRSR